MVYKKSYFQYLQIQNYQSNKIKFITLLAGAAAAVLFLMDNARAALTNLKARAVNASTNKVIIGYVANIH